MPPTRPAIDDPLNAFCTDTEAFLPGAASGPLAGLHFAAKDIFDVAGHISGGGNPDWKATHEAAAHTAWAVQILVEAGATMVGKTHTDELTRGLFGENAHYGTPLNPRATPMEYIRFASLLGTGFGPPSPARLLAIGRATIYRKVERYGLQRSVS